jgi:preprotein translocase subunit SecD
MNKSLKTRMFFVCLVSILSFWLLSPTVYSLIKPNEEAKNFPKWMPKSGMKLGLDLKGGIHMVLGIDLNKVVVDQLVVEGTNLEKALGKENIIVKTKVLPERFELEITLSKKEDGDKVASTMASYGTMEPIGQADLALVSRFTRSYEDSVRNRAIDQSLETIRNRIDEFGVAEPNITKKGENQILVQFPGEQDPTRLKNLIGQTAQLTFQIVHECKGPSRERPPSECLFKQQADLQAKIEAAEKAGSYTKDTFKRFSEYRERINADLKASLPPDTIVTFQREGNINIKDKVDYRPYLLSTKNTLSGEYISNAFVRMQQSQDSLSGEHPVVAFDMSAQGIQALANLTTDFKHTYMAIVLDGVVKSAPFIREALTNGGGIIEVGTGTIDESVREAKDLSIVLRAGALPASIEVQEERVIGPSMGLDAIKAGKNALIVSTLLIFAFMWLYYGASGFVAVLVTAVNVSLIFAILGLVGSTLTLPGIAGVVLTIGMAVDAMIIIYERMREEIRAGRTPRQVVDLGFENAFSTILDSNVTTAIGGFVLLQYGTGTIRGFALTLIVGILVNVFMATFFAKAVFEWLMIGRNKIIGIGMSKTELKTIEA